jgi:glycosyltransferase involved in cell wall biosynthesis
MSTSMQISVVMAVYNGERFLREAVESVLAQTFRDFEFIAVDDGSTDASRLILEEYAKADSRLVLVFRSHSGLVASLNAGIEIARSELIARFDADDRMLPNRLERQLAYLKENPEFSVVCSHAYLIDVNGRRIGRSSHSVDVERGRKEFKPSLFLEVVHPSVVMRKAAVTKLGGYRDNPLEDRDLWGRLVTSGDLIGCQKECLLEYRLHGTSKTVIDRDRRGELVDVNVVRRLKAEPELSYEEYLALQLQKPLIERLRYKAKSAAMLAYKNATRHYSERRMLKCAALLMWSIALRPWWTINRTRMRLSGLGHDAPIT